MYKGLIYLLVSTILVGTIWWICSQKPVENIKSNIEKNRAELAEVMKETAK